MSVTIRNTAETQGLKEGQEWNQWPKRVKYDTFTIMVYNTVWATALLFAFFAFNFN